MQSRRTAASCSLQRQPALCWDLEHGNPYLITKFPTPGSSASTPSSNPTRSASSTSRFAMTTSSSRSGRPTGQGGLEERVRAGRVCARQQAALPTSLPAEGRVWSSESDQGGLDPLPLEMATGTGKTLVSAAVIKLFLRTQNARRVLFLVDRLELEDQAKKALVGLLSADFTTVVYKETATTGATRDHRHHGSSLLVGNKYQSLLLAHRLRPRDQRRGTPFHRWQRPRRVRIFRRREAWPHSDAARLPQGQR